MTPSPHGGADPAADPAGGQVSAVLSAYLAAERARDTRALAVHAVAALSVPLVLQAVWPSLLPADGLWLVRGAWGLALMTAAGALALEWRHRLAAGLGAATSRPGE